MIGVLASCAGTSTTQLSPADRAALKGRIVAVARHDKTEPFMVMKSDIRFAGALLGAGEMFSQARNAGERMVSDYRISDPTGLVTSRLSSALARSTGAKPVTPAHAVTAKGEGTPAEIAATYPSSDYILDLRTTGWGMGTQKMNFRRYYVGHGSKLRLIETKTGRVVAEGFHSFEAGDEKEPGYEDLTGNGARFLKEELKNAGNDAEEYFKTEVLGI
ncbi:MAG: hypothetical protein JWO82_806 [Akkermansiaceae bacterium]|nr:hypothetical protein [Akkermansiaceae bacterium]